MNRRTKVIIWMFVGSVALLILYFYGLNYMFRYAAKVDGG
jgi:hypothetical protein